MKASVIIQARTGSTRLPNKVMKDLCGKPMLQQIVERVQLCRNVDRVIVATTTLEQDDAIAELCRQNGYNLFRGSCEDVLDRYYQSAKKYQIEYIVRMTADNALFDPGIIDEGIAYFFASGRDYIHYREGLPLGTAVEIFRFSALERAWKESSDQECREHVTVYMYRSGDRFSWEKVPAAGASHADLRLTTDTEQDFQLVSKIYNELYVRDPKFTLADVYLLLDRCPQWKQINASVKQKEVQYNNKHQESGGSSSAAEENGGGSEHKQ